MPNYRVTARVYGTETGSYTADTTEDYSVIISADHENDAEIAMRALINSGDIGPDESDTTGHEYGMSDATTNDTIIDTPQVISGSIPDTEIVYDATEYLPEDLEDLEPTDNHTHPDDDTYIKWKNSLKNINLTKIK